MPDHEEQRRWLLASIDALENELRELRDRTDRVTATLASARRQLSGLSPRPGGPRAMTLPAEAGLDAAGKVALFRSLFRGREDVFPRLWVNAKTGKKGYAPACRNEWVRGVCDKPRVRCSDCPGQAFVPVSDDVVLDHLQGRHVIGCYPLLLDETCWFVAVDFDEAQWRADVTAFARTCTDLGLPVAVERSRSGNGAHAWSFFSAPVRATSARRMASYLLTETMSRRYELSMESYDRLFPNQDTMPRGGFGNLIALPLQRGPRNDGNTVFLDPDLDPWPDQWAFLAGLRRLSPGDVEAIAGEAQRNGLVTGVRAVEDEEDDAVLRPWRAQPRKSGPRPIRGPLPEKVHAVLAQRLFVEKQGLDSSLLDQIQRLAAFQNPEFFKKQNLRLSTALTPRVISCSEELPRFVSLPRGCVVDLGALLAAHAIPFELDDERIDGDALTLSFRSRLTPRQDEAARALLEHETGVLVSPPGTGKTVIGAWLVAARSRSTLVLVHRQPLLDQWVEQLSLHLGLDPAEIGRIGGNTRKPNRRIDVAMMQSLVRGEAVDDLVGQYGHVVVDECHHVPAVSFERLLSAVRARFVVGLTATAKRRDGHHPILHMQVGPIRCDLGRAAQDSPGELVRTLVVRETSFRGAPTDAKPSIQALYAALARDEGRNDMIVADVTRALEEGRSPLVLTERRDHLDVLAERLGPACPNVIVLRGGAGARSRRETLARLRALPVDEPRLLLATGRYIGEGFDDSRLDTLFLALPISWRGTLVQYAGRLHRPHAGKLEARIVDYVDREVPVLARMFERRRTGYRSIGYRESASDSQVVLPSHDGDLGGDRTGDPLESHKR